MSRLPRTGSSPAIGGALGIGGTIAVVLALLPFRDQASLATPALLLVVAVVVAGLAGGARAAVITALVAALGFNLAYVPPYGTLKANAVDDYIALGVFLVVAVTVGVLVAAQADRRRDAEHREAELRELYDQLKTLSAAAERAHVLEQVDEQRSAMLRSVSHDLRTPLAAIRAVASDLRAGVVYDDATRTELLDVVCDEADRLDRLVANLLSLSRIEAGAMRPERQAVDVAELVQLVVHRLDAVFRQVRVEIAIAPSLPLVDADHTQLEQVVANLLENAARHAPPRSTVRVEIRRKGDAVEVRIADEGTGVPDWERERIFEPFRRGDGSQSSGIGLAICRAVIEAHGGRIAVESTPGGGATFVFSIPVRS
ncbi:MAG TPA: ATP-binding protein [Acidimicrobiales bacterium]|nr:ATP-binding protein [Acidimicrobiales bacterium]